MNPQADLAARLAAVRERIARAAERSGRKPEQVTLVGVAKRKSAAAIVRAARAGLTDIGENYVQEALAKIPEIQEKLGAQGVRWHFIGGLQRNKAGPVASHFDLVQTVDRSALGAALDRRAAARGRQLDVLLQVDVSGEESKGGVGPRGARGASRGEPGLEPPAGTRTDGDPQGNFRPGAGAFGLRAPPRTA